MINSICLESIKIQKILIEIVQEHNNPIVQNNNIKVEAIAMMI